VIESVSQLGRFTAEIEVPVYQASECGVDVLLQMLSAYHLRVRPVQLVTTEHGRSDNTAHVHVFS
jgi:hypothetical protein